jgi:serine protein kinase
MAGKLSILSNINKFIKAQEEQLWTGTLEDYISLVVKNPAIHMTSHTRVLKMIESHGVEKDASGKIVKYNFFKDEIFGVDSSIDEIVSYLRAAAAGSEVGRRILLMYGPTSSGKSQLAIMLKKGLEKFSQTEAGAIYGLSESPMNEDPLTAIPHELREEFLKEHGIKIEGELSPLMSVILKEKYSGNFLKLPVRRYLISEKNRASIGTFVPSDKKSQDISELIGSMDLSTVGQYGSESDPRAYKFDGELNVANRGIMEFIEMLKVDQKFLYVLLTLAQEKNIKTPRFPLIFADEFLLSHTNENEFRKFLAKEEMEALHDRIIVVKVPYNLSVANEVKIYEKLIAQADFKGVHVSPHALYCAAMFAILSRLKESANKNLDIVTKMKLYNGESVEGFTGTDVSNFMGEYHDEGMGGVSPRYIINRISSILAETGTTCITPIDVIRSIRDGFKSNAKLDSKEVSRLEDLLTKVIDEYSKIAKNDVQKAFFLNFEEEVSNLLSNYLENVNAFLDGSKIENDLGQLIEPNEKLMRAIEEKIQVTESGKRSFRQEISRKMARSASQNSGVPNYKDHFKLREALEKQLFEERQDVIRLTVSTRITDEGALKKLNVVINTLCEKYGYTAESANKLLRYVSSVMART